MPLKLSQRGRVWYARGTVAGRRVYESTRTTEKEKAEAYAAKREAAIWESRVFGKRPPIGFGQAVNSYLDHHKTSLQEGDRVDKLAAHFGDTPLSDIDQAAIDRAYRKILRPGVKGDTKIRNVLTPLTAILNHAHRRGWCDRPTFERPKASKGRTRWLQPDQAEALIGACATHMRPIVVFMLYTGARVSEALGLDWHDVDLQARHVVFRDTKNGTDRGVPLHARVVAELANLDGREGLVFRRPDGKPYKDTGKRWGGQIKTGFRAACRRACIKDFSPHDCRHTWATWLYAANRDIRQLMELGGWTQISMVQRYVAVNPAHLRGAIDLLPDRRVG